ncbi:hypothetical protein ABL78_5400 [Leptomonas seymouri]|uniref:Uncharacterized protein n=1 Tax=Leptomonas seymouri TaxID=5684 RepID=A0A0N1PBL8_LEPSE|nr:hypothetical protein ABL78_5400 [Leptomonas seymouri]|eukprot:KPI85551.1 hypothetical protein ABL78_5400 [Leptomonas seymouri]
MSREHSPEIVLYDENHTLNTPYDRQCGATRHVDAQYHNGVHEAKDLRASSGKPARTSALSASLKSDSQAPFPAVSQLRTSASHNGAAATASEARTSTATMNTANGIISPTQSQLGGAAATTTTAPAGRPPAVPPLPLQQRQLQQPQPQQYSPVHTRLATPSISVARAAATSNGGRRVSGCSKSFMPKVSTTAPDYSAYVPDVAKFLKEVVRRRDEAASLKLLPSAQLLEQAVLQEQAEYEQIVQQQALAFMQMAHKKMEAEAKMKEQQISRTYRSRIEEQKQQQREEAMQQKASVAESAKEMEAEIKERLRLVVSLQPRLNVVQAVMAHIQDPASDCSLLGELLQEDKQLLKALKSDARYNRSKTASVDGGSVPYWWKQCVCASFNIAAIVKGEPVRASIMDVSIPTKVAADKKVVVVKDAKGSVVAWAHTRTGPDTNALVEAFLESKPVVTELPASAYKGVLWPKDDSVEVLRAAKGARSTTAAIAPEVITILSYKEVGSFELPKKDVVAAGEAAS